MQDHNLLPSVLRRLHTNQLALGCAIEELASWVEQHGSMPAAGAIRQHLASLELNADFIGQAIVKLTVDP